ncbi:hypothetical protein HBI56_155580 [Parastagonospora nodorum]|uniref:Uncharacterized protein n=2 Tax=Phaeosphaeria nodorum (strain SN15 / ATCC MYA-4574 / FGSC 10173) TaxID=321614 RepID=A0A7U2I8N8_PHANO|nr:hypothetical protein SNOG_11169 [Parastagonospora nodorum SN15]KAH3912697.1 hypothetical protein HBH56_118280 [Parastagonospora nodorum]EAT81668.1 hypothetical protein SNOG_11169 [Parastagonospora nodorum SN15]KAH3928754.1 hypothetical protein HBH54_130930 [Parastagonospora nodorum]KAH3950453.1 hypothetical protein HBH53_071200 [Parastagonospora nodorum]KAH3959884.1 hypothetical protein HBH51_196680 [Parastagonospora nodorum]
MESPQQSHPGANAELALGLPSTDFEFPSYQAMPNDQPYLKADIENYATALEQYPSGDGKYVAEVLREFLSKNVNRGDTFLLGDTADDRKVGYLLNLIGDAQTKNPRFADLVSQLRMEKDDSEGS